MNSGSRPDGAAFRAEAGDLRVWIAESSDIGHVRSRLLRTAYWAKR